MPALNSYVNTLQERSIRVLLQYKCVCVGADIKLFSVFRVAILTKSHASHLVLQLTLLLWVWV